MSFEIEGKLLKKFPVESKTESFQAREFVLEIESGNYPQYIKFQLVQDKCSLLDDYNEGETIRVFFDLRGREWQGKYFTNLNAWRLDKPRAVEPPAPSGASTSDAGYFPATSDEPTFESENDLPF